VAQGIGLAIVRELIGRGAAVVVLDPGVSISGGGRAARPRRSLSDQKPAGAPRRCAVRRRRRRRCAIGPSRSHTARFGGVDIVVNNDRDQSATASFSSPILRHGTRCCAPTLPGAQRLLAAATPARREHAKNRPGARAIVTIVIERRSLRQLSVQSAYARGKGGLLGLTRVGRARSCPLRESAATRWRRSPPPASPKASNPPTMRSAAYKEKALRVPAEYVARLVGYPCERRREGGERPALRRAWAGSIRLLPAAPDCSELCSPATPSMRP